MSDTLSGILRAVRLSGAVFFTVDATAPWATETPEGKAIAPRLALGGEHVIDYHIVRSGSCWGGIVGQPAIRLEAGDVIVFPHGDTHVMSSEPGLRGHPELNSTAGPLPHYQPPSAPMVAAASVHRSCVAFWPAKHGRSTRCWPRCPA